MKKLLVCCFPLLLPAAAGADQLPTRKAGLWSIETTVDGAPAGQQMKQCVDASTDAEMMAMGKEMGAGMGANCSAGDVSKQGDAYVSTSDCTFGGMRMIGTSTFRGDFSSEYTGETVTKFEPPMMGKSESRSVVTAKWLGPCEPGQEPGDIVMANGMKLNLKSMKAMTQQMTDKIGAMNVKPQ